jgi:hypothetical protein
MEQTLDYQPPVHTHATTRSIAGILLIVAWFWTLGGLLLIFIGFLLPGYRSSGFIESIIFTGPALAILGISALIAGILGRSLWLSISATGPIVFPGIIFLMIVFFGLGPRTAVLPVAALAILYLVLWLPVTALAWVFR